MKIMISINWRTHTLLSKVGGKFLSGEDAGAPQGVTMLGRWHDIAGKRAWILVDSDDSAALNAWAAAWSDHIDWQMSPVVEDEEVAPIIEPLIND